MTELSGTAWLAAPGFRDNLLHELSIDPKAADRQAALPPVKSLETARKSGAGNGSAGLSALFGDLVYREGPPPAAYWHQNVLYKPFIAEFNSIREAADILRGIQRNWAHYPVAAFRRAELIRAKLPSVNDKPKAFPRAVPLSPMGMWSLLDERTLFASALTSSPFPAGDANFAEDHENPPSRAYMKLFEALTLADWIGRKAQEGGTRGEGETKAPLTGRPGSPETATFQTTDALSTTAASQATGTLSATVASQAPGALQATGAQKPTASGTLYRSPFQPGPGSRCVEAGACPGGWTWVLDLLGAEVTAIDRSELDPRLMKKPNVRFLKHDAFTLKPEDFGPTDWVFSDVICYPARLYEWIEKWLESGLCGNFACTIKMQGAADHDTTRRFAAIPGSTVVHLGANKNELTWIRLDPALSGTANP